MLLSEGTFSTLIATVNSQVKYEIHDNYEIKATFRSPRSIAYKFIMNKWVENNHAFNTFARLILNTFSEETTSFGSITRTNDSISYNYGQNEIVNMLKYSMLQVFICTEEIIIMHQRTLLDYAMYHRDRFGYPNTYEEYIHLVACQCLVDSSYFVPGIDFPVVEYVDTEQRYREDLLTRIDEESTKD
jgi:hypothetical protein